MLLAGPPVTITSPSLRTVLCLVFLHGMVGCAQEILPRRVFLGIRMENLTDDMRRITGLGEQKAVLLSEVLPGGTAAKAKWMRGDMLTTLNGTPMGSTDDVFAFLGALSAGQNFQFTLVRDKKEIKGRAVLASYPEERYPDIAVEYGATRAQAGLQRVIHTRSKSRVGKRLPAVVFIGGIACYSLDLPLDSARGEIQLLNRLARKGFACARLEKPGIGDGAKTCKPCGQVSFMEELDGYVQAIRDLKQRPDIDSNNITIIGHSMGGVFGPLAAQRTPVQRIIAYGTIGSNFIEYLAKTRRTIGEAQGWPPEEIDAFIKDYCECATWYFADHLTTAEVAAKKPVCAEYVGIFDARSRPYNDELYALNIPGLWKDFSGQALLLWGESDFISAREDHALIEAAVNHYHPGHAEFKTVPAADHPMNVAASFQSAVAGSSVYNTAVGDAILTWLERTGI